MTMPMAFQNSDNNAMAVQQQQQQQQQPPQIISSYHHDYIHKVVFDTYGRRMATCSADRFVRVWDLNELGEWYLTSTWQAHRGGVTCIAWAHPEFGSLLATSGTDHDAKIWEERSTSLSSSSNAAGGSNTPTPPDTNNINTIGASSAMAGAVAAGVASSSSSPIRWNNKASLTEARRSVTCLEFAPRHWGLKLAVGSADGCVRIYEAVDTQNLSQWPMAASLQAFQESKLGCTSLSWCTGRFEPPTLVAAGAHLQIYRYSESARSWQPLLQLPPSSSSSSMMMSGPSSSSANAAAAAATPRGNVLEVSWAPNVGRSFHYIASAEGQQLRIYKLLRNKPKTSSTTQNDAANTNAQQAMSKSKYVLSLESSQTLRVNAWSCQWNVTGTVLASSGDAGIVQLWKADHDGQFRCVSKIQGDVVNAGAGAMSPSSLQNQQ